MDNNTSHKPTPSEFYRSIRPEYFSDSESSYEFRLTKEILQLELNQITTNQKEYQFETFCRRLAEKTITPNLIPQVGPTGGGDGKTDFETYPVSEEISNRWFIPENGWSKDEKWAFAISAKKTWKEKAKSDVKKILGTEREYTKIFFITNQSPSSKQKKELQDSLKTEFETEIIILDNAWIVEKIFDNNLTDLAVMSLGLSEEYKKQNTRLGSNDAQRLQQLEELERNINTTNRYSDFDYQLVEDCLQAAIIARMLEKPKDEVEGKFDRAIRFCKKVNSSSQWIRILYQRAWTYINWFNDYSSFIEDFKSIKKYISDQSNILEVQYLCNLLNIMRSIDLMGHCNLHDFNIDFQQEQSNILQILESIEKDEQRQCSSLIATTFKLTILMADSLSNQKDPTQHIIDLNEVVSRSNKFIDYPFEMTNKLINVFGPLFSTNKEFDCLIDTVADVSQQRSSEMAAGEQFMKRAFQKISAGLISESIVWFGKAVLKLAKEESQEGMYFCLLGLASACSDLGLIWSSNCYFISATRIALKPFYESRMLDRRLWHCVKKLAQNELLIGRIPSFLTWHEFLLIIETQLNNKESTEEDENVLNLHDGCLANRILNTDFNSISNKVSLLPGLFEKHQLWISKYALLYKLGHQELILKDKLLPAVKSLLELETFFNNLASQPFRQQIINPTDLLDKEEIILISRIIGCKVIVKLPKVTEALLLGETLLAFLESFLATSIGQLFPTKEIIEINILEDVRSPLQSSQIIKRKNEDIYDFAMHSFQELNIDIETKWQSLLNLAMELLKDNFQSNQPQEYFEQLFKKEEVIERLILILQHPANTSYILGNRTKFFLNNWLDSERNLQIYPQKKEPIIDIDTFKVIKEKDSPEEFLNLENIRHNNIEVISVIDDELWNKAKWSGFGLILHPQFGFFISLGYQNGDTGKEIFRRWSKKTGSQDTEDLIQITIIRGINKNNPNWYRVLIKPNLSLESSSKEKYFYLVSKPLTVEAHSPDNLNMIVEAFQSFKEYTLCPSYMGEGIKNEVYFEEGIKKYSLNIRDAWEIGENDFDRMGILEEDQPVIPSNISDAPVLQLLQQKRQMRNQDSRH